MATVNAADVAEALDLAWWAFRKAAGGPRRVGTWPARQPRYSQRRVSKGSLGAGGQLREATALLRGDLRCNDAPRDGDEL